LCDPVTEEIENAITHEHANRLLPSVHDRRRSATRKIEKKKGRRKVSEAKEMEKQGKGVRRRKTEEKE